MRLCVCSLLMMLLPTLANAGWFGPPQYVKDACKKWCDAEAVDADSNEACKACTGGPQTNSECENSECDYCKRDITFPRHYPKLWKQEPSFHGKMTKLEGKTRCWCDTGCPVYYLKSMLFCHSECNEICKKAQGDHGPDLRSESPDVVQVTV
eukprot:CAMPEP_0172670766 /NCGR_PEP_ID=MMETSP1074-20121228/10493_1 /TAXON_ID=2916 /ORGANISM="Ceratium fusus, Strain PA161109" /LENGTH=151 /DNA_ID=CAMNT_0013487719 /DNA_START=54 /DNA_END=509 /DNA_ORIENTATION=+